MVDFIRRTYTTEMRFGSDPSQRSKIRWVWAQEGAEDLGLWTPFVSRAYDLFSADWGPLGEIRGTYVGNNSERTSTQPGTRGPCGDTDVWGSGYRGTIPPDFPRNRFGVALCCGGLGAKYGFPILGLIPQAFYDIGWVARILGPAQRERRKKPQGRNGVIDLKFVWSSPIPPPVRPWTPGWSTIYPGMQVDPLKRLLFGADLPEDARQTILRG